VQVKKSVDRWSRLALAAAMMAALGLAACGRKGGLDPPPSAGLTTPQSYASRPSLGEESNGLAPPPAEHRARAASAAPASATAAPPPKKTFFLDFLLAK
jgi:predicted small lipoprotein YifL